MLYIFALIPMLFGIVLMSSNPGGSTPSALGAGLIGLAMLLAYRAGKEAS